jgi:hypothetical protein
VVILDNRILGRDYGKAFLDVLPPASRFVGPAEEIAVQVGEWLEAKASGSSPLAGEVAPHQAFPSGSPRSWREGEPGGGVALTPDDL